MSEQIIVGYDGTPSATEAVWWAAAEAMARSVSLRIAFSYDFSVAGASMMGWGTTEAMSALMENAEQQLQTIRAGVAQAFPALEIATVASPGPVVTELERDRHPDDLVVVGASHHHGSAAFWLGSTPRYLVRHSVCPVAVVRGAATRGRPDRIVVGVDGSQASNAAIVWAADEADRHEVGLHIVHGWWYPYMDARIDPSQAHDLTEVDAACTLERAVEFARERCGSDVTFELVEHGPVSALLDGVRDGDWLVLGSHGRGGVAAGLVGSTVNSVLDRASVPVIVVRAATR